VDLTTLPALSSIASEQSNIIEKPEAKVKHMFDYFATKPDMTIGYYKSKMILNIHLDALYFSKAKTRSRVAGYFCSGANPVDG
jgi:hypothetical protein